MTVRVYDGKKASKKQINTEDLRVEGQTSGEWVHIGDFRLPAGKKSYAEISGQGASGTVVADAILWVPRQ
jgi:hypothetical protein